MITRWRRTVKFPAGRRRESAFFSPQRADASHRAAARASSSRVPDAVSGMRQTTEAHP